jgi:hypothetical protein
MVERQVRKTSESPARNRGEAPRNPLRMFDLIEGNVAF